ncbi:MaoC family dehydratase [Henriciella aquimarina]|uniref:MaoC family dehydratase n=1 Tax=Henriciella aquimarina TaxID=545261 RepID=UPI000A06720A|nr:MaoC family dehydratase [Henriciella aquimarina]
MTKSNPGHYFEDFKPGMELVHATPLTLSTGDISLYRALTGSRHALYSAETFARANGFRGLPVDPLLAFHVVFGKTVPDISLNAVANLGYAEGTFAKTVYPGDTLTAISEVIGTKENSNGKTGVVWVRTRGENQSGETVLSYVRWVMVNKKDPGSPAPDPVIPELKDAVPASDLTAPAYGSWDASLAGSKWRFGDYAIGETIDHVDGMTVEEAEHQIATRAYQNTAKVHFDAHAQKDSRFGKRLIYGGVVISIARALSFNGLESAAQILAINAGTHAGPLFAGDTVYAWSEVLDKAEINETTGALRLRLVATKDHHCADVPLRTEEGKYHPDVLLDFDYWAAIPI